MNRLPDCTRRHSCPVSRRQLLGLFGLGGIGLIGSRPLVLLSATPKGSFAGATSGSLKDSQPSLYLPFLSDASGWNQPANYETVITGDIDGDGRDELITRGASGILAFRFDQTFQQWVQLSDGPAWSDQYGWNQPQYYQTIMLADIDGDGRKELLARDAYGIKAWKFVSGGAGTWQAMPDGPALNDAGGWNQPFYYKTIQAGDINGDRAAELIARDSTGIRIWRYSPNDSAWFAARGGPAMNDGDGWTQPQYYETIQLGDIDGDGRQELLARDAYSLRVWKPDNLGIWEVIAQITEFSDANGWNQPQYYQTIQTADVDGDGKAEILARDAYHLVGYKVTPQGVSPLPAGPSLADADGWSQPQYYRTIQFAPIEGNLLTKRSQLIARSSTGIHVWDFDPMKQTWMGLQDGPAWSDSGGWGQSRYYETIQTGHVAGDGHAELIARDAYGLQTWSYSGFPAKWTWINNGREFPQFDGAGQRNAYQYLSTLYSAGTGDFRSRYSDLEFDVASATVTLSGPVPASIPASTPFSADDWNYVTAQLREELAFVASVRAFYSKSQELLGLTFDTQNTILNSVVSLLSIAPDYSGSVVTKIGELVSGALGAALSIAAPYASVAILLAGSAISAAELAEPDIAQPASIYYPELAERLLATFNQLQTQNAANEQKVLQDYGLLGAMGTAIATGAWRWPSTLTPMLMKAAQAQYRLQLWQTLTANMWQIAELTNSFSLRRFPDYPSDFVYQRTAPSGFVFYDLLTVGGGSSTNTPPAAALHSLFDPAPNGMGVALSDIFLGNNGWSLGRRTLNCDTSGCSVLG